MHLWPSVMLRDSFKGEYLRKAEWNLQRMKSDKKQKQQESSSNEQALLGKDGGGAAGEEAAIASKSSVCGALRLLGDLVLVLSCSYCCFCCGVCINEEDML